MSTNGDNHVALGTPEFQVLRIVIERLEQAGIVYMLTGSMALNCYARPRMTRDVDIIVDLQLDDADAVCSAFEHDFYLDPDTVRDAIARRSMFNIIHLDLHEKADLIIANDDDYSRSEISRRRRAKLGGIDLYILAPEDLVIAKLRWFAASGSEQQSKDIGSLLDNVEDLDTEYITHWCGCLGIREMWERFRERHAPGS